MKLHTPIRLQRSNSSSGPSCLTMPSARCRPIDQYFSQMDNIRLAERILLMKPSVDISKTTHKQFYNQQKKYKNNICINKSMPFKNRVSRSLPWADP